ncbi:ABC transporter permease [Sphaerisporangium krabiense]|uniref:ABC-2 type transport system permease protein n=1 Tax=Sphaerisporangium krabiense TaxID=763782 RepID=A0A7W8ZA90_9ACTN|nr:ABC transporter permease subunit [Sphaerisporangium krabiense]MBB5630316.1 ABC-2 type transport system permease protein [Sphaerisporangium krabiense]GII62733.1 ABC transporter permease [Sphaerisporangium krabiense]
MSGPARTGARETAAGNGAGRVTGAVRGTLPLRVEFVRQFRRRRTLVMFGLLLALPWILVAAFALGPAPAQQSTLRLSDLATQGGLNFAAFVLSVSATLLLVVAVALFCGDTVASEASWSSLRYLLAAPVPRDRLLRQKLVVALAYSATAVVALPLMALLAGTVAFGWNDIRLPGTGETIAAATVLPRFGIVVGYALVSQLVVAALAFLLSVSTDSPLGAVGGAVGLVIVSNILQAVEALGVVREFLPTFWNTAWLDALAPELDWSGMTKGASLSVTYAAVLVALAFRRFRRKDVVS